ncbi:MAG: FAD-dependent monooxygenase [Candidatus Binatia bacterium]
MRRVEVPVLIVGAGPVGTTAAILLARQGIACRVVERRRGPQAAPAAHAVNARTLEICRQAGVDMAAVAAVSAAPADAGYVRWMTTLAGDELGCLPYERQGEEVLAVTPTPLRNISQHRFEPILHDALRTLPAGELCWEHEWQGAEQDAAGVTSRIAAGDGDPRGAQPLVARRRRRRQPRAQVARHRSDRTEPHPELHHDPLRSQPAPARRPASRRPVLDRRSAHPRRLRRPRHGLHLGLHARLGSRPRTRRRLRRRHLRRRWCGGRWAPTPCRSPSAPSAHGR